MILTWKRGTVVGGFLAVVGLVALALRPTPVTVETARATRAPLRETVDEEGWTRVRDRFVVTAPVAGRVGRLGLREGDTVHAGEQVARLYPAPLDPRARDEARARVAQADDAARAAQASSAEAEAALGQARRASARVRDLAGRALATPEERERAELDLIARTREAESADFRAQAATHDAEVARAALRGDPAHVVPLRSPITGLVLRVPEPSERVVAAGAPIMELGDAARLEVVADLLSADAVRVQPGASVLIEGWGGDSTLAGRVRTVEPSGFTKVSALGVEEQRVNVVADLDGAPRALGDRYRVDVRIVIWESAQALQVPAGAVFRSGSGWAVFMVTEGRAQRHDVTLGHRTPFAVEITRGLQAGDVVICSPSDRVADGVRVR